jgi:type II secretory pathway predicted ATPase ExeA/DNA-binding NarL/FixJ family response regulator
VVDDDPEARQVLGGFLARCGLSVLEAQNGLEALLSVRQRRPGVVVLDLNMPRLGGLEALKRIRRFDPAIRVAVVTWDSDAAIHQQARVLGATAVLTKPVDLARLGTALGLSPADPRPIGPVSRSASPPPETPPRPAARRPLVEDDETPRRDEAPGAPAAVASTRGLELRALLHRDCVGDGRRAVLESPRPPARAVDVSPAADLQALPRRREVAAEERPVDDAQPRSEVGGPAEILLEAPAPGVTLEAAGLTSGAASLTSADAGLTSADAVNQWLDAPPGTEPGPTALHPAGLDLPADPGKDDERRVLVEANILVAERRSGRGGGETVGALAWLVDAVRALLGSEPAQAAPRAEEARPHPAPGVEEPPRLDAPPARPVAGADGRDARAPGATNRAGRLQEDADATMPRTRTMSYYGILGLTKEPFSTSPDPAFFYESGSHKAVLYRLQIAIKLKRGLSLVLGDVGMGKTTLSRKLFQVLRGEEKVSSHLILNPAYDTEAEFLTALVRLFGITPPSGAVPVARFLEILEGYLFEQGVERERTVVLLIDEAQRLSSSSLELLRALLNYETNEYKLLQLVLMGQMELLPRIRDMKNLWDRISLKCVIDPLDHEDTEAMIGFRLRTAGYDARRNLFTPEAIQEIHRHSHGSPRRITTLCHDALEHLAVSDKDEVDEAMIRGLIKQVLA